MSSSATDRATERASVRLDSLRTAHEALAEAARKGERVLVRGAGTAQSWGAPVEDVDVVLDTTGLDELVAYNPADMTVAVGAGMRLATLQARLEGQRVALDAARVAHGATVGGLLATVDGGPIRAAYGTLRDLVIGVTVVLADGTVARSGGHVIKNVAGYDLAKLFCGSLGALGLVAEVVLRVHPRPEATATLAVPCDAPIAFAVAGELLASPVEPVALDWHADRLLVRFEGTTGGVSRRVERAASITASAGSRGERLEGADEEAAWRVFADDVFGADGDTVFRAGTRPDRMPYLAARLEALAVPHGVNATLTSSVGIGVHTVLLRGGEPAAHAEILRNWRADALEGGGSVTVHRRAAGVEELAPSWGRAPSSLPVLRALKRELDPDGRLCPGRFAPWF